MWTNSHTVSVKVKIKSHLTTLEHILLEWFVKWMVYKILDKALERIKFEGKLHLGDISDDVALSIIDKTTEPVIMVVGRNLWRIRKSRFSRNFKNLALHLPELLALPLFFFAPTYRRFFLMGVRIDLKMFFRITKNPTIVIE